MASPRLKKDHKVEIVTSVLEEAAKERMEILKDRENQIARAAYLHYIKGYGKHIQAVPAGYYSDINALTVTLYKTERSLKKEENKIGYQRCTLQEPGRYHGQEYMSAELGRYHGNDDLELGEAVRMPESLQYGAVKLLVASALGQEVMALKEAQSKLYEDLKTLGDTVRKALIDCTTVKKLVDHYPELKKYVPKDIDMSQLAVAHGRIDSLIECTKKTTCEEEKPKRKTKKPAVIAL
jgi:hypothetical protein